MRHLFIVNPVAGNKDKSDYIKTEVKRIFEHRQDEYEVYITKAPMDACDKIWTEAVCEEELRVYACGGDGTLNECVNGAANLSNVSVAHFPTGTGNDFIKIFGDKMPYFFDLKRLVEGSTVPMDLIDCNGRYSINICSVGIDARIGVEVHKYSSIPLIVGKGGYLVSTAVNFVRGVSRMLTVRYDGKTFKEKMTLICACNGGFYGGAFNPIPEALPNDGIIDFLLVKKISRLGFINLIGKYAKGRYADMPKVITHYRGGCLEIESDDELAINVDGECLRGNKVRFQLAPSAINFVMPRDER